MEHRGVRTGIARSPRELYFGASQRKLLGSLTARLGSRAFLLADPAIAATPEFDHLAGLLRSASLEVEAFTDIRPELPVESIGAIQRRAKAFSADVIVAVGGGSCIDTAKLLALLLAHGGKPQDYYGDLAVPGPAVPVVAVPTTAGTGSEVTPVAVLADSERATKVGISSPHLVPAIAICDPELTYSCPPAVTANSGADALTHCIEAYTAKRTVPSEVTSRVFVGKNDFTDALALEGIRAIVAGLETSFREPSNATARESVMYGSLLGGLAFGAAGTAAAHALQYPIGAMTHTPHGVGVGLLLPYVMAFNRPSRILEMAAIARLFGFSGDDIELADRAPFAVADFLSKVGIPRTLADIGLSPDALETAAEQGILATRLVANNPRALTAEGALTILSGAMSGDIDAASSRLRPKETIA